MGVVVYGGRWGWGVLTTNVHNYILYIFCKSLSAKSMNKLLRYRNVMFDDDGDDDDGDVDDDDDDDTRFIIITPRYRRRDTDTERQTLIDRH